MKIEISIEKEYKGKEMSEGSDMEEGDMEEAELTPEQIAMMAKKIKTGASLSRSERTMLANYLMSEAED